MQLIKSQFVGPRQDGDFSWMIERPEYARSLFIFNDNEMQFIAFHTGHEAGFTAGGGNAAIRPYQGHSPIRAAGFPPIKTFGEPMITVAGGPTQTHMSPSRAAGRPPMRTVNAPTTIGPPTWGTGPVSIGQT